jgi:exosortase E/protease (VPEID-CTERM system)
MFLLNSVRIAVLVLIGDAGYPNVAIVGFHSQAGWIAFNGVAFGVAWLAKRSVWLNRSAHTEVAARTENPTAPYLVPLLAVLAAGMAARALSAGFDFLYPVRLIAGAAGLIAYRSAFGRISWRVTWRGPVAGAAVFALWSVCSFYMQEPRAEPLELARAPAALQNIWIACRTLCAVLIVPIAEELAYRGYLMRVLRSRAFDTLPLAAVGWPALLASSAVFGASHGALWFPGTIAGMAYGWLAMRTNSLGEAVSAHAVTNALVALEVGLWGHWQLW